MGWAGYAMHRDFGGYRGMLDQPLEKVSRYSAMDDDASMDGGFSLHAHPAGPGEEAPPTNLSSTVVARKGGDK